MTAKIFAEPAAERRARIKREADAAQRQACKGEGHRNIRRVTIVDHKKPRRKVQCVPSHIEIHAIASVFERVVPN